MNSIILQIPSKYLANLSNRIFNFYPTALSLPNLPSFTQTTTTTQTITQDDFILNGGKPGTKKQNKAKLKRHRRKFGRDISFEQPLRRQGKVNDHYKGFDTRL